VRILGNGAINNQLLYFVINVFASAGHAWKVDDWDHDLCEFEVTLARTLLHVFLPRFQQHTFNRNMFTTYAHRPCLGVRASPPSEKSTEEERPHIPSSSEAASRGLLSSGFVWLTFEQVFQRAMTIGAGMMSFLQPVRIRCGNCE